MVARRHYPARRHGDHALAVTDIIAVLEGDTVSAARAILGWTLTHETSEGITVGRIVETEAYTMEDPASHAFRGPTPRNAAMFRRAATAYVYRIHQQVCLNVVTRSEAVGEAILIRALEPLEGVELMHERRGDVPDHLLCAGPGRLCRAMGITMANNFGDLLTGPLRLLPAPPLLDEEVVTATRIGISRGIDFPWRFYLRNSRHVSKRVKE